MKIKKKLSDNADKHLKFYKLQFKITKRKRGKVNVYFSSQFY